MKLRYLLSLYLLGSIPALAGTLSDTTYIKKYPQKSSVSTYAADNSINIKKNGKLYEPNNLLNLGLALIVKNTIVNLDYDFGIVPLKGAAFGKTNIFDFQVHHYGKKFIFDLTTQNYQGFYYQENNRTAALLYPNLSVLQIGAEGTYIFNGNKYSARAAFDQSELQLQSAGSFILGGGAYFHKLDGQNQVLSADNSNVNNYQIGFNAGYAYTEVLSDKWLLCGMVTAGSNFGNQPKPLDEGRIRIYPTAFARASSTYHKANWDTSFIMLIHETSVSNSHNENIGLASINFQISYVRHIDYLFRKR